MTQASYFSQRVKAARKLPLRRKRRSMVVGRSDLAHFGMAARRDKDRNQNDRVHTLPSITGIRRSERVLGRPPTLPSHSTPSAIVDLKNRRTDEEHTALRGNRLPANSPKRLRCRLGIHDAQERPWFEGPRRLRTQKTRAVGERGQNQGPFSDPSKGAAFEEALNPSRNRVFKKMAKSVGRPIPKKDA